MHKFAVRFTFALLALSVIAQAQPIIVDNGDSTGFSILSGSWFTSTAAPGYYGEHYLAGATTAHRCRVRRSRVASGPPRVWRVRSIRQLRCGYEPGRQCPLHGPSS